MERDTNQKNVKSSKVPKPDREIVDESLPEGGVDRPEAGTTPEPLAPPDQSAVFSVPVSSLAAEEADPSDGDSDSEPLPEASEEDAAPKADALTQSGGNVTRLELPAEVAVPLTRPPEAPRDRRSQLLPLDRDGASEDEPNPVDQIFPPEWRLPADPGDPGAPARTPELAGPEDGRPVDRGPTMPRVQVLVSLANTRAIYAEAIEEALEKKAPKYREIARSEVQQGFWEYENQRRAADWCLRGP